MSERSEFRPDDTGELKERWRAYVQDRRLNVTAQREAIVEQFLRTREHVSIDELLLKVTANPAMLLWLNGTQNVKEAPNENYGREMMELFTLGAGSGRAVGDTAGGGRVGHRDAP